MELLSYPRQAVVPDTPPTSFQPLIAVQSLPSPYCNLNAFDEVAKFSLVAPIFILNLSVSAKLMLEISVFSAALAPVG